ncbi:conjugal transfer protein [Robertkochia marina]|uniref:Conjugal transfer protein n=1 Tax=Robertkochia marina TaxID=1227945 RepID=A0A4S3LZT8_9FLAO|nr:conjugal transfer protein [Robertkochia marina]THD67624.1 conjugal transfer protein [Robertkochia marina]TRZ43357.1 conjugal transfer protein [Robertkochia marina]
MKLYIFLLIGVLLFSFRLGAQGMPVYDNTNFLTLGKQLLESGKQTSQLIQTVNFLKQQKQRLEQVNGVIRDLKLIGEIIEDHKILYVEIQGDFNQLGGSNLLANDELRELSESLEKTMASSMDDLDMIRQLLRNDHFKMTDKDRIDLLEQRRKRMEESRAICKTQMGRYRAMVDFRKMVARAVDNLGGQ